MTCDHHPPTCGGILDHEETQLVSLVYTNNMLAQRMRVLNHIYTLNSTGT